MEFSIIFLKIFLNPSLMWLLIFSLVGFGFSFSHSFISPTLGPFSCSCPIIWGPLEHGHEDWFWVQKPNHWIYSNLCHLCLLGSFDCQHSLLDGGSLSLPSYPQVTLGRIPVKILWRSWISFLAIFVQVSINYKYCTGKTYWCRDKSKNIGFLYSLYLLHLLICLGLFSVRLQQMTKKSWKMWNETNINILWL